MNKEHIPVITDREELYDKCENMEQLFDKYYLPLLDKHYSKTYKLQQENKQLKEELDKYKNIVEEINQEIEWVNNLVDTCELVDTNAITIYKIIQKYEKSDSNE